MLVQVCPPGAGGVRDFADCLAREWAARGVASEVIEGRAADLQARLEATGPGLGVVLHFSGYGYAPRGLCGWLPEVLARWRSASRAPIRLVVVFHELFAGGAPWRSAFWLAPWQAQVARRLARLADGLWTNTAHHAGWLRGAIGPGGVVHVQPVFSNIGERVDLPAWDARAPRAVVFGSEATRQRAFAALRGRAPALAGLGVREIVEAGAGRPQAGAAAELPVRHLGRLSADELAALLAQSRFGIVDYPARYLGKSGVFAAYAAHACAVIDTFAPDRDADGIRAGEHYVNLDDPRTADDAAPAAMARRLHDWYGGHSLARQAAALLQLAQAGSAAATRAAPGAD